MQNHFNDNKINSTSDHIHFYSNFLIYKTIQRIFEFQHSGKLLSTFKSQETFRVVKTFEYQSSNEIEVIKSYPHINKHELKEFSFLNSHTSCCPPRFSSLYSPIKHILNCNEFDGIRFHLRYAPNEKFIFKHSFSSQENSVNDYQTTLISNLSLNTERFGRLRLVAFNAEFLRYTYNLKLTFPLLKNTLVIYNAKYNILNERKDEIEFFTQIHNFFFGYFHSNKLKTLTWSINFKKGYNFGFQLRHNPAFNIFNIRLAGQLLLRDWFQLLFYYKENSEKLCRVGAIYQVHLLLTRKHNNYAFSAVQAIFHEEMLPIVTYGTRIKFNENIISSSINSNGLISTRYSVIVDESLKVNMHMSINPFENWDVKQRNFGLELEFFP